MVEPAAPARPTIDEISVGDDPRAWAAAGFTVDADGTCRIGSVRVRLVGPGGGRGVRGWSWRNAPDGAGADVDGIPTTLSTAAPAEPAPHPCGAVLVDHLVIVSPDGPRTASAVADATGLDLRRTRDADGDPTPMQQRFFRAGEVILEIVSPTTPDPTDRRPARVFGLALLVDDIDALPALYGENLGRIKDAVQEGRRIATLRSRALDLSVAIAFMSPGAGGA